METPQVDLIATYNPPVDLIAMYTPPVHLIAMYNPQLIVSLRVQKHMAHGFGFRASVIGLRSSRHSSDAIVGMSTVVYKHERRDR